MQADIVRLERFVERFRAKKDKAKQAQAKLTQIGRLEKERQKATAEIALLSRKQRSLGFEFLKPARSGRTVLEADGLDVRDRRARAAARRVVRARARRARRARRAERLRQDDAARDDPRPARAGGRPRRSSGTASRSAYFSQQELELDTRGSVLQCVQTMTGLSRPDAQSLLGKFLFSGWDEHEKPVAVLSGGERRRLALAVTVASGANFLVLDEPTNHLDLESREALEAALDAFPGTVLLVSHDRALLDAVAERTLAIEDGELHAYDGGWAEMLRRREERAARAGRRAGSRRRRSKAEAREAAAEAPERARADRGGDRGARGRGARRSRRSSRRTGRTSRRSPRTSAPATRSQRCSSAGSSSSTGERPSTGTG